jgi:hypothetical protein
MRMRFSLGSGVLFALAAAGSLQCGKAAVDGTRAGGGGATHATTGTGGATHTTTGTGGAGGVTTTDACAAACAAEKGCNWDFCAHFADEFFPDATFQCPTYECVAQCMLKFGACHIADCYGRGADWALSECVNACPNWVCNFAGGGASPDSACMRAIAHACGAPYAACRADAACSPYALCFADCSRSDFGCLDACEKKLGDGSPKQRALLACACAATESGCWDVPPLAACTPYWDGGPGSGGHAN